MNIPTMVRKVWVRKSTGNSELVDATVYTPESYYEQYVKKPCAHKAEGCNGQREYPSRFCKECREKYRQKAMTS